MAPAIHIAATSPRTPPAIATITFPIQRRATTRPSPRIPATARAGVSSGVFLLRSSRSELHRRLAPPLRAEAANILERGARVVFVGIGALDGVARKLASNSRRADRYFAITHAKPSERILEKRAVPAFGLQRPRPREHAGADDHGPYADEPMIGTRARSYPDDLAPVDVAH